MSEIVVDEYARRGGWFPAFSSLIRWLNLAGCSEYISQQDRETVALANFPTPQVEISALTAATETLAHICNDPPRHLTQEQRNELLVLRRQAARFVHYRSRQLDAERQAMDRAARSAALQLAKLVNQQAVSGIACESSSPGRSGNARRRPGMSVEAANSNALALARCMGSQFFSLSWTAQARKIGCHLRTWKKTPFFKEAKKRGVVRTKGARPRASSLTGNLESSLHTDEGTVLDKLIADQQADNEPSPLDDSPAARSPKVYSRRRL